MNGRERIRAALEHQEADRVPLDLSATVVTGITKIAYENYRRYRGLSTVPPETFEIKQQLARVDQDVLDLLGVDAGCVNPRDSSRWYLKIKREGDSEHFHDEFWIGWRRPVPHGLYYDMFSHPLADAKTIDDLKRFPWPDPTDPARFASLEDDVAFVKAQGRAVVLGRMMAGIFEMALWMRGFENFYCDLASNDPMAGWLLDKLMAINMEFGRGALSRVGKDVDVYMNADDLASQNSLLISPEMYRKFLKPRHTRMFAEAKRIAPGIFIFFHSCGAVRSLIGDLIESGVDAINPVQVNARDMDSRALKREFGRDVTFWGGGCDTQEVLPRGTPEQVREEVKKRIEDLAPGGGFVFNTVHNIQADVPPENIHSMYEALAEFGRYR